MTNAEPSEDLQLISDYVVVNAYAYRNAGDAAIVLATRDILVALGAGEGKVSSRYADRSAYYDHGLLPVPEVLPYPEKGTTRELYRLSVLVLAVSAALVVIGAARVSPDGARKLARVLTPRALRHIRSSTTVIIAGGGYMYSSRKRINLGLIHCMVTIRLGSALAKRVIMMPQSIGPVTKRFDARLIRWGLRGVRAVARETLSLERSRYEPKLHAVSVVPDAAFYTASPVGATTPHSDATPIARIVVMDWSWSSSVPAASFNQYLERVAHLCDLLVDEGWSVVLGGHSSLPEHGQDDIDIARRVASQCASEVVIDTDTSYSHLIDAYRLAGVVIGTRLHSCIMALSVGTPAIALAYQEKSRGVMGEVGLSPYVQDVHTLDPMQLVILVKTLRQVDIGPDIASARQRILDYYSDESG